MSIGITFALPLNRGNRKAWLSIVSANKQRYFSPWSYFLKSIVRTDDVSSFQSLYTPTSPSLRSNSMSLCDMMMHCVCFAFSSMYLATRCTLALSRASSTSSKIKKGAFLYWWSANSNANVAIVFSPPDSWLISRNCFPTGLTVYLTPPR